MIALGKGNVISLNVRGLRNRVKSIFCFLKDQNCDVFFLQETYSEPNDENTWQSELESTVDFRALAISKRGMSTSAIFDLYFGFILNCLNQRSLANQHSSL